MPYTTLLFVYQLHYQHSSTYLFVLVLEVDTLRHDSLRRKQLECATHERRVLEHRRQRV